MLVHTCYYAGIVYLPLLATILKIIAIKLYHTDWVFTSIRCREHYLNSCFTQLLDNYHQTQSYNNKVQQAQVIIIVMGECSMHGDAMVQ